MRYATIKQSLFSICAWRGWGATISSEVKECSKHAVNAADSLPQGRKIAPIVASRLPAYIHSKTFPNRPLMGRTHRGTREPVTPSLHPTHNTRLRGHTALRPRHLLHSHLCT